MTATETTDSPQAAIDDFFCKDIPEPFQILGLRLLPLSIGRYRRMARHGVAFVSETQAKADGKDLLLGVLICSMDCSDWDNLATSGKLTEVIARWMKQINAIPPLYLRGRIGKHLSRTWLGKLWRKHHSFDLFLKMGLFKQYIEEAQLCPRFLSKGGNQQVSSSHWSHNIEVVLRGELGWTREEIEERPLSSAIADYFKHMENQGLITILTEADFAQINNNDVRVAAAVAEWQSKGGQL